MTEQSFSKSKSSICLLTVSRYGHRTDCLGRLRSGGATKICGVRKREREWKESRKGERREEYVFLWNRKERERACRTGCLGRLRYGEKRDRRRGDRGRHGNIKEEKVCRAWAPHGLLGTLAEYVV